MDFFKRMIDVFTLGSDRPIRRLVAYYFVLAAVVAVLFHFVPYFNDLFSGARAQGIIRGNPQILQDALTGGRDAVGVATAETNLDQALKTMFVLLSTLALMLPVSWVFMSARQTRDFNQSVVQTLLILPLAVAGIVLVVHDSLALAFSLAGIVAGVRFRSTLRDVRDTVYIFLGIGVGLTTGVQSFTIAAVLTVMFNFVVLLVWRYDFGRNVLQPTAASHWSEPLGDLADTKPGAEQVPDRDLVLALSPKKAAVLAKRFDRVHKLLGTSKKKPRFNAILTIVAETSALPDAQSRVEVVLDSLARRWRLDQVVTNEGKPSELFYLVGVRKTVTRDRFLTAVRSHGGDKILSADLEIGDVVASEKQDAK
jgi:hypothetical protein